MRRKRNMTVFMIETRYKDSTEIVITASYERTQNALNTAEARGVDVIITPYEVEDLQFVNDKISVKSY